MGGRCGGALLRPSVRGPLLLLPVAAGTPFAFRLFLRPFRKGQSPVSSIDDHSPKCGESGSSSGHLPGPPLRHGRGGRGGGGPGRQPWPGIPPPLHLRTGGTPARPPIKGDRQDVGLRLVSTRWLQAGLREKGSPRLVHIHGSQPSGAGGGNFQGRPPAPTALTRPVPWLFPRATAVEANPAPSIPCISSSKEELGHPA